MEYEEPAESLVTAGTCEAATDVAADKPHGNRKKVNGHVYYQFGLGAFFI